MNASAKAVPRELDRRQTVALARTLVQEARLQARGLMAHATKSPPALETVLREVLAFATCLGQLKFKEAGLTTEVALAEAVAQAHYEAEDRRKRATPSATGGSGKTLLAKRSAVEGFAQKVALYAGNGRGRFQLTDSMFEEFSQTTGLDTKTLVGNGANLATLVFYIIIFGLLGSSQGMTRASRNQLLQAARACKQHWDRMFDQFLAHPAHAFMPIGGLPLFNTTPLMLAGWRARLEDKCPRH